MKLLRRQSEQEMVGSRTPEYSIRMEKCLPLVRMIHCLHSCLLLGFLWLEERVGFANEGSYLVVLRACQAAEMWHHAVLRRSSVFNVIRSISYAKCHLVRNSFKPLLLAYSFH
jgi:hypothetical protein